MLRHQYHSHNQLENSSLNIIGQILLKSLSILTLPLTTGSGPYGAQVESNMLNYDLTPAKWASGNSTMRFSVEN